MKEVCREAENWRSAGRSNRAADIVKEVKVGEVE
jgi:hypothetical protein